MTNHSKSFAECLERLWQDRYDGDVLVRFAGGKPQYIELLERRRLRCVEPAPGEGTQTSRRARQASCDDVQVTYERPV